MAKKRFTEEELRQRHCDGERRRRLANPEKKKAKDAAYRVANADQCRERSRRYLSDPAKAEAGRARAKAFYYANQERCRAKSAARYEAKKAECAKKQRTYAIANRDKLLAARRRRYHSNPSVKISVRIRSRLADVIRKSDRRKSAIEMLGCTLEEARIHIESLFTHGMTWANWNYRGWHLDHVRPLIDFDLTDPEQLEQACHYTNLQPLWMKDNLSKFRKPQRPLKGAAVAN